MGVMVLAYGRRRDVLVLGGGFGDLWAEVGGVSERTRGGKGFEFAGGVWV
jgi:hypothetical protein